MIDLTIMLVIVVTVALINGDAWSGKWGE